MAEFVGGQTAVCTPVLFVMILAVLVIGCRQWRATPTHLRMILLSAGLPLLFFAGCALRKKPEANWPVFCYFPGTLLVGAYLAGNWAGRRRFWAKLAVQVALVGTLLISVPELVWRIDSSLRTPQWDEMFGWRELARRVDKLAQVRPVLGQDYRYAAELEFYLPGQPPVWQVEDWRALRRTQYDYFPGPRPNPDRYASYVLVRRWMPDLPSSGSYNQYSVYSFPWTVNGHHVRTSWIGISHK